MALIFPIHDVGSVLQTVECRFAGFHCYNMCCNTSGISPFSSTFLDSACLGQHILNGIDGLVQKVKHILNHFYITIFFAAEDRQKSPFYKTILKTESTWTPYRFYPF